ncbi:MAG TPA: cytochrome C oxidase subunit I [Gammaproteobacteria bacterium]|nr:cytochrome C oxidase subunit I [Gammaproteobacteria bacterium]
MQHNKVNHYELETPGDASRRLATGWLLLAIAALVLGGVLTLLIVLSRTPGIQTLMPWNDFFHTAIVVHVDLTVLVWFLACAGMLWSLTGTACFIRLGWWALWLAAAGTALFTLAPFIGAAQPLMNNYVPVLQNPVFLFGLGLFGSGITLLVLRGLLTLRPVGLLTRAGGVLRFGLFCAVLTAAVALAALATTYLSLPSTPGGRAYFELLFWGSGHALQFTHSQLMLVAWLVLAGAAGVQHGLGRGLVLALLALGLAPVVAVPWIYLRYEVTTVEHITAFTRLMRHGGGAAPLVIGAALVFAALRSRRELSFTPALSALLCSITLFGAGGLIGFLISGVNVTIPAHYHGAIVAVTLAFMGLAYHLLPRLGYAPAALKPAAWQPLIYGGGQLLHVVGLAWSGGYGVQRKTAGAAQHLDSLPEIAGMALMGLGGLIAVIGGVLFLLMVIKSLGQGPCHASGAEAVV